MNTQQLDATVEQDYAIHHDLHIKAPAEKVYSAISQPEGLASWWPLKCSGEPQIGNEYNFYFAPDYNWFGKVIACEQNKTFRIQMTKADDDWNPTSLGFELSQNGDTTHVSFHHTGWPECNAHYKQSSFCWAMLLNGLKDYVEKGIIVPFEDRE